MTNKLPDRKPEVWVRKVAGENALFDPATEEVHLLNDTALAIWDLCDGQNSPAEMIEAISDLSGLNSEVVSEDVQRTLASFEEKGLIEWREQR